MNGLKTVELEHGSGELHGLALLVMIGDNVVHSIDVPLPHRGIVHADRILVGLVPKVEQVDRERG